METSLPTVKFGTTDMDITRVGFGAWAIGGGDWKFGWGPQDDDAAVGAMVHAAERGINWIDTAAVYGLGHSEVLVGKALKALPEADRPYVFTKGGLRWDAADSMSSPLRIGDPEFILWEIDQSLMRLGIEQVDLFQMHWPAEDNHTIEQYWGAFAEILESGKARAIGLSNHPVADLMAAEKVQHVDSLQPPFNMLRRDAAADVIPWCGDNNTGVIVYSPMASGILTGAYTKRKAAALSDSDWRSRSADFNENLDRNLALVKRLGPIAKAHGATVGAVAVAWTLSFPGVSGAIVGGRSPEQVDGWAEAGSIELSDAELTTIREALVELDAGDGPLRPVL